MEIIDDVHFEPKKMADVLRKPKPMPMVMPPKPVAIAIKRALSLPVFAFVRFPLPNGKVVTEYRRIA